ncbi:hypothetical protein [Candidatus Aalborgicola defluviihabitans]|jgi:hypothetical protein|uniref:hypothetical protein n=1 Tax=Candidatus Aalborgicola defluviihabitans TaxID=3386187 RepID=UPI001D4C9B40|nr:hypothetical protein [Burkholderiales bacterium]
MSSAPLPDVQPLGLTVHTLPDVGGVADTRTRMGRWKMLAVLLVCATPVIASYFTYYVLRPEGRRNFGTLIDPQRALPDVLGTTLDGKTINLRSLKDQWLLVSVAGAACDVQCAQHLYMQRQLREGLGKDKDRLDWVWLVSDGAPVAQTLLPALKDATVLRVAEADLARWLQPENGHAVADHLYLVDPLGNWMMRFPPRIDTQGAVNVRRDLDRLLRASSSWDKAGR